METSASEPQDSQQDFKFEEAIRRLQQIVTELEGADFNLDEALVSYEQGVAIAKECLKRLEEAELRIKELRLDSGDMS